MCWLGDLLFHDQLDFFDLGSMKHDFKVSDLTEMTDYLSRQKLDY